MSPAFQLTPQAVDDVDDIWNFIAADSPDAANRVQSAIFAACRLSLYPLIGKKRQDITSRPVRFWTIPKFSNYVIVYRPDMEPLQILAVLHGKRDLKPTLKNRP